MNENRYGIQWTEDETILAFYWYCQIPFGRIHKSNPEIIELAKLLGRTPSSVGLKMANLGHFDPGLRNNSISGMGHASKLDEKIVLRFINNWEELAYRASQIEARLRNEAVEDLLQFTDTLPEGLDREQILTARVNQQFFRNAVLSSYQQSCCITGLAVSALLVASHIKPWRICDSRTERTDPHNGLCLNALHDKAFDRGLITVMPDLTIRVSSKLKSDEGSAWLRQCDRQRIRTPDRFLPAKEYLEYHNDVIFIP